MKRKMTKIFGIMVSMLITLAVLIMPVQSAIAAPAAGKVDLVLLPASQTVNPGANLVVTVQAQCGTQTTDGIDAFIDFNPLYLAVQSITAGTALQPPIINVYDNILGTINFAGAGQTNPALFPTGNFTVATITFTAKSVLTTTNTAVSFHTSGTRITMVDLAGNNITGTLTGVTYTINDIIPPIVQAVSPINNATGVPVGSVVAVTFSEAMNPSATVGAFSLKQGATVVPGALSWNPANTILTFTPAANLALNTNYIVGISTAATDTASTGNHLAAAYSSTFTTQATVPTPLAVVTLAASAITNNTVTLNGNLTSKGTAATVNVSFEYGYTTAYGKTTPAQPMSAIGTFSSAVTGLFPGMVWHYRAKAVGDSTVYGADMTFTTTSVNAPYGTAKFTFVSARDGNEEVYGITPDGVYSARLTSNVFKEAWPRCLADFTKVTFTSWRDGNAEVYWMNPDGTGQTRLTSNAAFDGMSDFAWNGSKIAFVSDRDGNYEIYVMNADGTGQTRLTNNTATDIMPAFSPDGTKIAFASNRDGNYEIYVMNANGTGQTRRTTNTAMDNYPSWLNDGSKISFSSMRDGNSQIYAMNADGTNTVRLTNNAFTDDQPAWCPTGMAIFFTSWRFGNTPQVMFMWPDGTNQAQFTNTPQGNWSRANWASSTQTYTINASVSGGNGTVAPASQTVNTGANATINITPDSGYHIASITDNGTAVIIANPYVISNVSANHTIVVIFSNKYTITATAGAGGAVSPSGDVMVNPGVNQTFTITPNSGYQISALTVDGSAVTPPVGTYTFTNVTANHSIAASFAVISTPPTVATSAATAITNNTVTLNGNLTSKGTAATVNVSFEYGYTTAYGKTTPAQPMSAIGTFSSAVTGLFPGMVWHYRAKAVGDSTVYGADMTFTTTSVNAPYGTAKFTFVSARDGNEEVYGITPDGVYSARLTSNVFKEAWPRCLADFTKVTFTSWRDGNAEVYWMNPDGTGQTRLTSNAAFDGMSDFAWNGSKIAFVSDRDGNYEIYVMNADGTGQTRLTNNTATDIMPAFSPDGTKIAFASNRDGNYEIYVMNANGTGQTRRTTNTAMDNYPSWLNDGSKISFSSMRDGNSQIYAMNADGTNTVRLTNNAFTDDQPAWCPTGMAIFFTSWRFGNTPQVMFMWPDGTNQAQFTNTPQGNWSRANWASSTQTYTINASVSGGNGTVAPASQTVNTGANATINITPDSGYHIASITDNGTAVIIANPYVISNVSANHTIVVIFSNKYTITATAGAGGAVSPSGDVMVNPGVNQTFTITPNSGYQIASITDNGTAVTIANPYVISNVSANHIVVVTFSTLTPPPPPSGGGGGGGSVMPPQPPPGYVNLSPYVGPDGTLVSDAVAKSTDGKVVLVIPKSTKFITASGTPVAGVIITPLEDKPTPPPNADIIGVCYNIEPSGAIIDPGVTIILNYSEWDLGPFSEQKLAINHWDNQSNEWVKLSDCQVDITRKTVTAIARHFSTFGIIGYSQTPASFTTSKLVVMPERVEAGADVTITISVANTGESSGNYTADLKIDGVSEATRDVTLNGGETQQVSFTVKRDQSSIYTISIGTLEGSFTILTPASYIVSNLTLSPNRVEAGKDITVNFKVVNTGEMSGKYTAALQIGGATEATKEVTLAGGEGKQVTFTVKRSQPGTHSVAVGKLSGTFICLEPAVFTVSELAINPTTIREGSPITVNFQVANIGQVSGTYTATLKVNDTVTDTKDITLAGSESQMVSFDVMQDKAGTYAVDAAGMRGSFVVNRFDLSWLPLGVGVVLLVVVLLTVMVLARRRNY